MMNCFRKHKVKIILIILIGFFGGTFIAGFGVSTLGKTNSFDAVAVVNGKKIPYRFFHSLYNNTINSLSHSGNELTTDITTAIKNDIVRALIQDELIYQQAKDYGITVSDTELACDIQGYSYFLNGQGIFDSRKYYQFLNNLMISPKDFETLRRKQIVANKLKVLIASTVKVSKTEKISHNDESQLLQKIANEVVNSWFNDMKRKSTVEVLLFDNKSF